MTAALGLFDLAVLGGYLALVLGVSIAIARRQKTGEDYFLAGRGFGGFTLALSILANQASAVSLVGAPAFVALREGGGLRWLQYELALPLAMLVLIALVLPALRQSPGASIYGYVERRFGVGTRRALAAAFLLSRGMSLGVILYASALVVRQALGWELSTALLVVGLASVAYTSLGGLAADVWSDVLQLALLWGGTAAAAAWLLFTRGDALLAAVPAERQAALVLGSTGLGDGASFALWPMLFGGLFLYASYYGCDQSQAQRLLAARSDADARQALVWNGLLRFPLVLTYCGFGLLLAGLLRLEPGFAAAMEGRPADALVPLFMATYLPEGLRGLLLAAILAAAMSSIDSALNSLAAVTLEDVAGKPPAEQGVWLGRLTALGWGVFAVGSAFAFARSGAGVLEGINQIGSALGGPVLAVFLLGALAPRVDGRAAIAGLVTGLLGNLALARFAPGVSWLWWNPAGCLLAMAVALAVSRARLVQPAWPRLGREAAWLGAAFVLLLAVLLALPRA